MNESDTSAQGERDPDRPRVALVAYDSLGDGLVYLMMAENLRRNGFDVTYYGHGTAQLADWLPQLSIRPYPEPESLESELDRYDLAIYCPPSFVRRGFPEGEMRRLAERYVIICQSPGFPDSWKVDHTERIRRELPAEKADRLLGLAGCSGRVRQRKVRGQSVVEGTLSFMRERMRLRSVTKDVELHPPEGLQHRRHRSRVVISPDSASPERKDWTPVRFLDLAERLGSRGYEPKIVVAPENVERWRTMPDNVSETPEFPSIADLAAYLYESGVVVANDSGNGHLASFLGVPTITIYRRMNRKFAWRPDWGPGMVVRPRVTLSLGKWHVWRPFISTARILREVERYCPIPDAPQNRSLGAGD